MTMNHTPQGDRPEPDALIALYRDATANDGGPGESARDKVLAHAREQALKRSQPPVRREAANDRRWLRHALGGLAVMGVVGWLTMQHLQEPNAPQLDKPAPAAMQPAPAPVPASVPAPAPAKETERESAADAVRLAPPVAAQAKRAPGMASKPAPEVHKRMQQQPEPEAVHDAPTAHSTAASPAPADMSGNKSMETPAPAVVELPACEDDMDAAALAEQARRIKLRDEARAAHQPLPEPAPICRPAGKK